MAVAAPDTVQTFALPEFGQADDALFTLLNVRYSRKVVALFTEQFGDHLDARGWGVNSLLRKWLGHESSAEVVWDLSFGLAHKALWRTDSELPVWAAHLALHLHEFGEPGEWQLDLGRTTRLRFGPWLLPPAELVLVRAHLGAVDVELRHQNTAQCLSFQFANGRWHTAGAERLGTVAAAGRDVLVWNREAAVFADFDRIRPNITPEAERGLRSLWDAEWRHLEKYSPSYAHWVQRVLRIVTPLEGGTLSSGSDAAHPGLVSIRVSDGHIAEKLVHETTHLYFHLFSRLGDVADHADPTLYYSAATKTARPARMILLAYHAFANVLLYYRDCWAHGLERQGDDKQREADLVEKVAQLEQPLRLTSSLTALGKALFVPLAERISQA